MRFSIHERKNKSLLKCNFAIEFFKRFRNQIFKRIQKNLNLYDRNTKAYIII